MRISLSNIGWKQENDIEMYEWMASNHIEGLEIAPTRIWPQKPYENIKRASSFADDIRHNFGLQVSSMQSIWYGREENIFADASQRNALYEYTKKAIDFAHAVGCHNLVFGCPRNRNIQEGADISVADEFFTRLGEYACSEDTVLSMEANPPIYNTNFINTTSEAIKLVNKINSKGFLLNLDIGTIIANGESLDILEGNERLINHVHISEPGLMMIEKRDLHIELAAIFKDAGYDKFVSLEVKTQDDVSQVKEAAKYMQELFKDYE